MNNTSMIPGGATAPQPPYFTVESQDSLVCPDIASPAFITNLDQILDIQGFEVDAATHSIKNTSGRDLNMVGSMAVQYAQTGGQPASIIVVSERSSDGITWVRNSESLRVNYVVKDGIDYFTIPSFVLNSWLNGEYVRFLFAKTGTGGITIQSPSDTVGGELTTGHSFIWEMKARK